MPTPEELTAALAEVKAASDKELEAAPSEDTVTDKTEIEAALADTVESVEEDVDEMTALQRRIANILLEYNNEVSSIPRSSEYWQLQNRYNTLRNP